MQQQYVGKKTNWNRDETILALDLYFKCNGPNLGPAGEANPNVIELSEFLNKLPIHDIRDRKENFRNPTGVVMKLYNFLRWDPSYTSAGYSGLTHGSKLEGEIWDTFASNREYLDTVANAIRDNYRNQDDFPPHYHDEDDEEDDGATEGKLLTRVHKQRERNSKLAKRKKAQALKAFGKLECEVCHFDFAVMYGGDLGAGVIDCHHKTPLSELKPGAKTKLSDLALVCPNCHRILHKGTKTISLENLTAAIG
jgi:5-methylcytosine-specific restriction protein A